KQVSQSERDRVIANLRERNVELYYGRAAFVDPHTIRVTQSGGKSIDLRGRFILIATGSSPVHPPGFKFEDPRIWDSSEILQIAFLPKNLGVVGAGVIGAEYACTFAALGTKVHIIDGRGVLLPFLDEEVSPALTTAMRAQLGIEFLFNERVVECDSSKPGDVTLKLSSGQTLSFDAVLVAAGRTSNTSDLNLVAAGITPGKRGLIEVESGYRTSVSHICAAGDVIGFPALAATSMEQARIAMCHAFDKTYKTAMSPVLPTGVYTIPEVSMVGETEQSLRENGIEYVSGKAMYSQNARGRIIGDTAGFLKLLFRRDDKRLVGVHVIGELATEVVHIGVMAMLCDAKAEVFNRACFN
ncbi:MAG: FAD-dependent oxidoreductase, partial [Tepidisphaeraceae bacterium]